jgi:ribonucleoside-diphosphate reductase alpha chain
MERPKQNPGETVAVMTGCGKLYVINNTKGGYPEVFLQLGKTGGCAQAMLQFVARLISFSLRAGIPLERIVHAGLGVRCPSPTISGGVEALSCADAICKALKGE